jgi:hypothetical protein
VIGVAECGADREPVMAYTVGMIENFGHPELIIFGVPAKIAATVLNVLGASFVSTGHTVPIDVPLENLFCRHPIVAKMARVDLAALYALLAAERAQTKGHRLSAVQLVWPDIKGHFPWEAAYDESLDRLQPRLFESSGR